MRFAWNLSPSDNSMQGIPFITELVGAIPHRLQLAGGWIDQPFVSRYNTNPPGSMSHPKTSETVKDKTGKILFLCTGNYYRSRFAENVFNFEAEKTGLKWHADSRGLNLNLLPPNFQNISPYTAQALKARNIPFDINQRRPLWLREEDLIHSDRVIALDKTEHHPILKKNFPAWVDRVEYWSIHGSNFNIEHFTSLLQMFHPHKMPVNQMFFNARLNPQ